MNTFSFELIDSHEREEQERFIDKNIHQLRLCLRTEENISKRRSLRINPNCHEMCLRDSSNPIKTFTCFNIRRHVAIKAPLGGVKLQAKSFSSINFIESHENLIRQIKLLNWNKNIQKLFCFPSSNFNGFALKKVNKFTARFTTRMKNWGEGKGKELIIQPLKNIYGFICIKLI